MKTTLVETGVDVGPAIYLARTFHTDIDTVVKFFIFILIFVFDPMAVSLVIAFNVVISGKTSNKKKDNIVTEIKSEVVLDKENIVGRDGRTPSN